MKNIAFTGALSCALAVAGCQSTGGLNSPSINTASLIQDAQIAAELACAVAPTALTIAAIVSANPAIGTANQIASIVCAKVASTQPKAGKRAIGARKGVLDYGTVTIGGKVIKIEGTPVAG